VLRRSTYRLHSDSIVGSLDQALTGYSNVSRVGSSVCGNSVRSSSDLRARDISFHFPKVKVSGSLMVHASRKSTSVLEETTGTTQRAVVVGV